VDGRTSIGRACRGARAHLRRPTDGPAGPIPVGPLPNSSQRVECVRRSHLDAQNQKQGVVLREPRGKSARAKARCRLWYINCESALIDIEMGVVHSTRLEHSNTVGLVVEYTPATGETRVRFSDGVATSTNRKASQLCKVLFLAFFGILLLGALFSPPAGALVPIFQGLPNVLFSPTRARPDLSRGGLVIVRGSSRGGFVDLSVPRRACPHL
jgi:hypothetical protein